MTGFFNFSRSAAVAAGSLLTIFAICGTANAVTDTNFKYTAPRTGYFTIDSLAMSPAGAGSDYTIDFSGGVGLSVNGGPCFTAGVNLPNGATITNVAAYYRSGMGSDLIVKLFSHKLADGVSNEIAAKILTDNSGIRKVTNLTLVPTPAALIVNNAQFSYGLGICLTTTDNKFYAARITYTYNNAGD